jgi:signal transduction histidine kinase
MYRRVRRWIGERVPLWLGPALACVAGLLATALALTVSVWFEMQGNRLDFERSVADRIAVIQKKLDSYSALLVALRGFWENSGHVTQTEFSKFAQTIIFGADQDVQVRLVEWIPLVAARDRAAYEEELELRGIRNGVFDMEAQRRGPAPARPVHYPITYFYPEAEAPLMIGFDTGSKPEALATMQRALQSGRVTISRPTKLVQDRQGIPTVLAYIPVHGKTDPSHRFTSGDGLIAIAISIPEAIESALSMLKPGGVNLAIEDVTDGRSHLLYYHRSRAAPSLSVPKANLYTSKKTLSFGDRCWEIACSSVQSYDTCLLRWQNAAVLLLGLLLTAIATAFTSQAMGQAARIRAVVKRRTQKLRDATRAARAASRAKSRFIANMSHEVRTPLNGIMGMAELLLETAGDAEQRRDAQSILDSAAHLRDVVNEVLDFAKGDSRRLELQSERIDLHGEINRVVGLMTDPARRKSLELTAFVDPAVSPYILGDSYRLRQVLLNLLSNALKFTETGSVHLEVKKEEDISGPRIVFSVTDTGAGISPSDLPRIFEPFVQADDADSRRYGGTGLGLTICRQLVDLMGGKIDCESQLGVGSRFWFWIPYRPAPGPVRDPEPRELTPPLPPLADIRVLVAEDNPVNQRVILRFLKQLGCKVTMTGNGRCAVNAYAHHEFDLVLLDLQMPEMDGHCAAREIRARQRGRTVPILAVSASVDADTLDKCKESSFDGVIPKPFSMVLLAQTLRHHLAAPTPELLDPPSPCSASQTVTPLAAPSSDRMEAASTP